MSDTQGWYQRKIAAFRQQQPAPQFQPQPQGYRPQPVPQYRQPQYPQQQAPAQQPAPPPQQGFQGEVTVENLYQAAGQWRGGPGAKANPNPCPSCGSNQYFSRKVSKRGPEPAPHCYNCGYNDGMFEQGLATSWGAG